MPGTLETPLATSPLPEGWSALEIVEDVIAADGVELRRAGLCATGPSGQGVTGSAVLAASSSPLARASYELLERVSTVCALETAPESVTLVDEEGVKVRDADRAEVFPESDSPSIWRYARSSGVALHTTWEGAVRGALWELAERDRVLRAWAGERLPRRVGFEPSATPLRAAASYEWVAATFPGAEGRLDFASEVHVAGVFGFPSAADAPLVWGYGARPTLADALDAATGEALQSLGFLWGEPTPAERPAWGPTPMHHLEWFQYRAHHALVRRWLDEGHGRYAPTPRVAPPSPSRVAFARLTPDWLGGGLHVAKAVCGDAALLAFGDAPFVAHLPAELRLHPIA